MTGAVLRDISKVITIVSTTVMGVTRRRTIALNKTYIAVVPGVASDVARHLNQSSRIFGPAATQRSSRFHRGKRFSSRHWLRLRTRCGFG